MDKSESYNWDLFSVKETAEMKGHARGLEEGLAKGIVEGLAKGLAKGKEEGVLEVAKKLKMLGLPPETIAQSTGLTLEEISKL